MDLNQYKQLDSDKKKMLWERLEAVPEFQLLKQIFANQARITARPTTLDNREAFMYEATRAQAIGDVLNYPMDQITGRAKYSTAPAQSFNE